MMILNKQGPLRIVSAFVLTSVVLCHVCYCLPASYKEDIIEVTTTPKKYEDHFNLKLQQKTKPNTPNESLPDFSDEPSESSFRERNREFENDLYSKVKAVMPGEKTLRQSDEDDDDDDDGGEYEGFDYSRDDKADKRKPQQQRSRPEAPAVAAVPMMIVREVDMVALQIPMKDPRNARTKEWSEWSPCSNPFRGERGLQSRWRLQNGGLGKEQEFRPCRLADSSPSGQFHPSFL